MPYEFCIVIHDQAVLPTQTEGAGIAAGTEYAGLVTVSIYILVESGEFLVEHGEVPIISLVSLGQPAVAKDAYVVTGAAKDRLRHVGVAVGHIFLVQARTE